MSDDLGVVHTNEELTSAAAGGLRWITYARIVIELSLLASMVVLARLISPAEFGIFAVIVIVQELALTMPMEGIGSALVQRREITREHLQGGLVLSIAVGVLLALVTLLAAFAVVDPLFNERTAWLVVLAIPWYLLGSLYAVPMAVLRRRLDFARISIIDVSQNLVRIVAMLVLAFAGLNAEALVLGGLAGMATAVVMALAFVRTPLPRWRGAEMRELLPYGGPASLSCVAWTGFRNGDYAIIGASLGTAAAGFYWRGYQLGVEYQRKISVVMSQMAFPVLARTAGEAEMDALRQRMVRLLTVSLFPLLLLLVLLAPVVVPWLFGPTWEPAVVPTQILALGGAAVLVTDAAGSALMAAGRSRALLYYGVAHFVVYAGAVLVVVSQGLVAVAITAAVVHALFLLVAYQVLLRASICSTLRALGADIGPAAISCGAMLVVAAPADWALARLGAPVPVHLGAVAAAGAAGYLLALKSFFAPCASDLGKALRRVLPARLITRPRRLLPASGEA